MKRKTLRGRRTTSTPQKPSEGSPKQVPPLGVLLRFLTSQVGYLTRENYKYDLSKWSAANHLLNWSSDSRKLRSKVSNDRCLWIGQRILKKHDLDPLADKKFYWDSSQVKLAMQSRKLRSKVSNDRCTWIMYTCELNKGFSKTRSRSSWR